MTLKSSFVPLSVEFKDRFLIYYFSDDNRRTEAKSSNKSEAYLFLFSNDNKVN